MTVTEQARHRLHAHLEEAMGEEHAAALMEWLPDGPLASRADVEQVRLALKADIEQVHLALKADIAHLREVMDIRWEQTATKADLYQEFNKQTWRLITAMIAVNGLFFTAGQVL